MICKKCNEKESRTKKAHYCEECFTIVRKESHRKHITENPEKRSKINSDYKKNNSDLISDYNKKYQEENKEILKEKRRLKRLENKEKLNEESRLWRLQNKEKVREYNKKNSPIYREKYPWRIAIRTSLRNTLTRIGKKKESKTVEILKYSAEDLKIHIQSLFKEGMSWGNYGEWEIDHIIPVASFDKETPVDIINSLSNLQPLWESENRSKGKKVDYNINI